MSKAETPQRREYLYVPDERLTKIAILEATIAASRKDYEQKASVYAAARDRFEQRYGALSAH